MTSTTEFAPAKINLSLNVGALGADHYHRLESLVAFADVGDDLSFKAAPALTLKINGPFGETLSADTDNLVLRAARALQKATGKSLGAHITLHKALPLSAGIGGGSADAAATLRGLNRLWQCDLSTIELETLGAGIGTDVPVCVQSCPRFMRGRGEILDDITHWPALDAVLVNPGMSVSTKQVFARFDAFAQSAVLRGVRFAPCASKQEALAALKALGNDLMAAACIEEPQITVLLVELEQHPQTCFARLCGSGATCLAMARCRQDAIELAADIQAQYQQHWVRPVHLGGVGPRKC